MLIGDTKIVTVIGQENCINCKKLKKWLEHNKVPYVYVDFDNLLLDAQKDLAKSRRDAGLKQIGLPLYLYDGKLSMGHDVEELTKLFGGLN